MARRSTALAPWVTLVAYGGAGAQDAKNDTLVPPSPAAPPEAKPPSSPPDRLGAVPDGARGVVCFRA
jgi:hypothetical protein